MRPAQCRGCSLHHRHRHAGYSSTCSVKEIREGRSTAVKKNPEDAGGKVSFRPKSKQKDDDDVKRNAKEKNGIEDLKIDELRCGSMNHSEADEEKKVTGDDVKKNKVDNEAKFPVNEFSLKFCMQKKI